MRKFTVKDYLKFIIPSTIGAFLFLFPIKSGDGYNIPLGITIEAIENLITDYTFVIINIIIFTAFICAILVKLNIKFITKFKFLKSLFSMSNYEIALRFIAVIIALLIIFKPDNTYAAMIYDASTGGQMYELAKTLFATFLIIVFIIPLISDFGLMDFTGNLFRWLIKPLFKLPGRAAVDLITSWVGGNASGILVTSKQYENGYYTAREAVIISTMFSIVSLPFCLLIAQTLSVEHLFIKLYAVLCIVGVITTMIMVRIPPLTNFKDTTYNNVPYINKENTAPEGTSAFQWGLQNAIKTASNNSNIKAMLKQGGEGALDLIFNVIPAVITIGTIGLILAEKTPIFVILSYPFAIYLNLLGVEEALSAAPTTIVGFADMFLPSIIGSSITSETTRVIIAVLSLVQIIYLSEMASILLSTKIPVKLHTLILLFLIKTVLAIPLIVLFVNLFGM